MGKISELDMAIRDLRTAASTINDVADTLAEMFSSKEDETSAPAEQAENADKQTLTFDQVSNALMAISRMSKEHSKKLRAWCKSMVLPSCRRLPRNTTKPSLQRRR